MPIKGVVRNSLDASVPPSQEWGARSFHFLLPHSTVRLNSEQAPALERGADKGSDTELERASTQSPGGTLFLHGGGYVKKARSLGY